MKKAESRSRLSAFFVHYLETFLKILNAQFSIPESCGEKTSPTPQADWSLVHTFKAAFDLNFFENIVLVPFTSTSVVTAV